MYLHLGADTIEREQDIVLIFDMDNTTISQITKNFLNTAENRGQIISVTEQLPKSYILCNRQVKGRNKKVMANKIYISQLSVATLKKRMEAKLNGFR